jgi:hypothetical protein
MAPAVNRNIAESLDIVVRVGRDENDRCCVDEVIRMKCGPDAGWIRV